MNPTERKRLREFKERLANVSDTDMAWFAGWLCADGCIAVGNASGPSKIKFTICDRDPLDRFATLFGNCVDGPWAPSGLGKLPRYGWQMSGSKALALMERCEPWLSDRYRAKARRASARGVRTHGGRKVDPRQVADIKAALAAGGHGVGRRIAKQYGITDGMVSNIKNGRAWTCVSI